MFSSEWQGPAMEEEGVLGQLSAPIANQRSTKASMQLVLMWSSR